MRATTLSVTPVEGVPEVGSGDDLAALLGEALVPLSPAQGDILAVAQKIVSKAEGRIVPLSSVQPSVEAKEVALKADKDPRVMELVLQETTEILRVRPGVVIVEDRRGLIMANAGIDRSNVNGKDTVLLLPIDPDASARAIRKALQDRFGIGLGVIVIDSFGRAWRRGVVGTVIGSSGVEVLIDARGRLDRFGHPLAVTEIAVGDALAAAAGLVMGEAGEGVPAALMRGWFSNPGFEGIAPVLRPRSEDLFR